MFTASSLLLCILRTSLWYIPRNFFLLTQLHDDEDEDEDEDDNTASFVVFTAPRFFLVTRIHDNEDDNMRRIILWLNNSNNTVGLLRSLCLRDQVFFVVHQ